RRQMAEVDEGELLAPERAAERTRLGMRQLEKFLEQAEFMHDLERRWMNRVAAEIAQEVGVLLQCRDIDAGSREEKSQHHPGGPAAHNAAARGERGHAPRRRSLAT